MKQTAFSKIVDIINFHFSQNGEQAQQLFDKFVKDCHPFVFTKVKEISELITNEEPMDVPFPVMHIELLNGCITIPSAEDAQKISIVSYLLREVSPQELEYLSYQLNETTGEYTMVVVNKDKHPEAWKCFNGITKHYLDRLRIEKTGVETRGNKIKLGQGKYKQFYRPNGIIHVAPKRLTSSTEPTETGRTINWSHAFEVRGHWRKVNGIGKDRTGTYCVKGFTWVVPQVRGKERGLLVKKTYLVNGEENERSS